MSIIAKMRKQTAVWWERGSPDRYGKFAFAAPVEVACRWDDTAQEFLAFNGEKRVSRAVVYVDRIMKPGDRLMRGDLESDTAEDPLTLNEAFEIHRFDQNPNIKATETLLTAFL